LLASNLDPFAQNQSMDWIALSEKDDANGNLENRLWESADQFRANSGLKSQEYSAPVLGLIFLRFAEVRFALQRAKLEKAGAKGGNGHSPRRGSRMDDPAAYHADGLLYLTPNARYDHLLALPEAANVGKSVNDAMRDIEKHNPQLAGEQGSVPVNGDSHSSAPFYRLLPACAAR